MSSIPQHGAHCFLVPHLLGASTEVCVATALIGMSPDLIALPETLYGDYSGTYAETHTFRWWYWIVFPLAVHWGLDAVTHDENGWTPMGYALEFLLDSLTLLVCVSLWL